MICRSAPERSKARIVTSRNYARSDPEPGGAWNTPNTCSRCASIVETATGRPIGPRSAEAARPPQIRTGHPYHEKSQRDCMTLDRTPGDRLAIFERAFNLTKSGKVTNLKMLIGNAASKCVLPEPVKAIVWPAATLESNSSVEGPETVSPPVPA